MKKETEYCWVNAATLSELIGKISEQILLGWTPKDPIILKARSAQNAGDNQQLTYMQKFTREVYSLAIEKVE